MRRRRGGQPEFRVTDRWDAFSGSAGNACAIVIGTIAIDYGFCRDGQRNVTPGGNIGDNERWLREIFPYRRSWSRSPVNLRSRPSGPSTFCVLVELIPPAGGCGDCRCP